MATGCAMDSIVAVGRAAGSAVAAGGETGSTSLVGCAAGPVVLETVGAAVAGLGEGLVETVGRTV